MKRTVLFLLMMFVCAIWAQTWIVDAGNSSLNQLDWRAPYWGISYRNGFEPAVRTLISPFYLYTETNLDYIADGANSDFQPSDGWVLLHVWLGDSNASDQDIAPSVVLYNKNTGIVRYFFRSANVTSHTQAFAKLTSIGNTGIINTVNTENDHIYALDQRNSTQGTNVSAKYIPIFSNEWMYADFYVAYDDVQQSTANLLQFSSRSTDVTVASLEFSGVATPRISTSCPSGIEEIYRFGKTMTDYIGKGNDLRDEIKDMADSVSSDGILADVVNKLTTVTSWLDTTGVTSVIPYIYSASGLYKLFSGGESGQSAVSYSFSGTISGELTTNYTINDFTLNQPGALSTRTSPPLYNNTLGVIQLANSPHVEKRRVGDSNDENYSYRLSVLPSDFRINSESNLSNDPKNIKIAYSFKLQGMRNINLGQPFYAFLDQSMEYTDFIECYKITYDGYYPIYHCFTKFIDYSEAEDIVINTDFARIIDIGVKIRAEFEINDTSYDPFIFLGDYAPIIDDIGSGSYFTVKPVQRVQVFTEDIVLFNQTVTMDTRVQVDCGATLRLENCTLTGSSSDYGFEVLNGRLELSNCTYHAADNFIKASGEQNSVVIENGSYITVNDAQFQLDKGADLTISNSNVYVNNAALELSETSELTADNSILCIDNGELRLDGSKVTMINGSDLLTFGNSQIIGTRTGHYYNDPYGGDETYIAGDKIEIIGSNIHLDLNTVVSSASSENWDGIYLRDCNSGNQCQIKGEVSGIDYLYFENSEVYLNDCNIHGINQLQARDNSIIEFTGSYHDNEAGMYMEQSELTLVEADVYNNGSTGVTIEHSGPGPSYIDDTNIFGNAGKGLHISNCMANVYSLSNIYNNEEQGYFNISSVRGYVGNGSTIHDNGLTEIFAIPDCFPAFISSVNSYVHIYDTEYTTEDNDLYLLFTAGYPDEPIDLTNLNISTADEERFFPDFDSYDFDDNLNSPVISIYNGIFDSIQEEEWVTAYENAETIISYYPDFPKVPGCITMLPHLYRAAEKDPDSLNAYLDAIADADYAYFVKEAKAAVYLSQNDYAEAMILFDEILADPPSDVKRLKAELDKAYCYYKLLEQNSRSIPVASKHQPKNRKEYLEIAQQINNEISNMEPETTHKEEDDIPEFAQLSGNYPNPFNPETKICFSIPEESDIELNVYNMKGQKVKILVDEKLGRGKHEVLWNGTDTKENSVGSGVYLYRLKVNGKTLDIGKCIMLK